MPKSRCKILSHPLLFILLAVFVGASSFDAVASEPPAAETTCPRVVRAEVVAFEQSYLLNRFGSFVPAGMMYALRHDVVSLDGGTELRPGRVRLRPDKRPRPLVLRVNEGDCLEVTFQNLLRTDWQEEGGVLPDDDGSLPGHTAARPGETPRQPRVRPGPVSIDAPRTRAASFHITGLELVRMRPEDCPAGVACGGDGSNVGRPGHQGLVVRDGTPHSIARDYPLGSLAAPGQTIVTRWRAQREGAYFAYSAAAPVGGEGDGGQIGLGLFASVNVEPAGSRWYRSQVTAEELRMGTTVPAAGRHDYRGIDYRADHPTRKLPDGSAVPLFRMLDDRNRILHSDLNAIVVLPAGAEPCAHFASDCARSFREFTVILHDEIHARQAFDRLENENDPLSKIRDGMGINYGASGMGSLALASGAHGEGVPPLQNCRECRAEEFFLSSWAAGDPALILAFDGDTPSGARWSDDPSNVHHSYLGDAVRFRNLHAGPKETHVFHLHAHQWLLDPQDPDSSYLDSQTISPGATFSYDIGFGGTGNRNYTPGDSIFHCHLYPHFAQGMWELWRVHDTFEDGRFGRTWYRPDQPAGPDNDPRWRNLPDGEIATGTPTPALLPIPGSALAPLPVAEFAGYPHYVPGIAGHRPPQPALDMDVDEGTGWIAVSGAEPPPGAIVNGGLPRHVARGGTLDRERERVIESALDRGGGAAQLIAQRIRRQADPASFGVLAQEWETIDLAFRAHAGEPAEQQAMAFHEGTLAVPGLNPVANPAAPRPEWWRPRAYRTDRVNGDLDAPAAAADAKALFFVNGLPRAPGAPFANPCPAGAPERHYRAAFIQTELVYNRHGWFDPQGRIIVLEDDIHRIVDPNTRTRLPEPLFFRANSGECIVFRSTNLVPSLLNVDDFQIVTPTDTIGQHIHLVKFDVTSSDGSGNGWNYEDGTFSPDEVRERVLRYNDTPAGQANPLTLREHPLFRPGGTIYEAAQLDPVHATLLRRGQCPGREGDETPNAADDETRRRDRTRLYIERLNRDHPFCGAQRTTQRWWADPILSTRRPGRDNTLRTVFTHDHFGPSSHQQHGLYAGLVVEPANSLWVRSGERPLTPEEVDALRGPDPAAPRPPMTLAEQGFCRDRAEALARGEDDPMADSSRIAERARCKLIGGSDLTVATVPALRRDTQHLLAPVEPRDPLVLRGDGGPTATLADIVAPRCVHNGNSVSQRDVNDVDVDLVPARGRTPRAGAELPCTEAQQNRREFNLALADFGIAYTAALEPVNPEPLGEDGGFRDNTALRFGRRHVASTLPRPLAISSEDPGSQFVNYRHEPFALRISEATPDPALGGFDYRQARARASGPGDCAAGDTDCLGDPANAFSSRVHLRRDIRMATESQTVSVHAATRALLTRPGEAQRLDRLIADIEQWRRDFLCALHPAMLLGSWDPATPPAQRTEPCDPRIERREPWRLFGDPVTPILRAHDGDRIQIRLIQGAQEAQHIFSMNGVRWRRAPDSAHAGFVSAQPTGISEHFEGDINARGFGSSMPDYFYSSASVDQIWDGVWGVLRVTAPDWGPDQPIAAVAPAERVGFLATARTRPLAETGIAQRMARLRYAALDAPRAISGAAAPTEPENIRVADVAAQIVVPALAAAMRQPAARDRLPPGFAGLARALVEPGDATVQQRAEEDVLRIARAMVLPSAMNARSRPNAVQDQERAVCGGAAVHRRFDVSAVQVCSLYGTCGTPQQRGISYSRRFDIRDDRAIIYVLNPEQRCDAASPEPGCAVTELLPNDEVLSRLREDFAHGRPVEPLVLRAPAGACMEVTLRNHLPAVLDDGPGPDGQVVERSAYHNFLPMITDGFNVNQFRMSSSVGLSAPRLSQNPVLADGSNLGWNGLRIDDEIDSSGALWTQGSLVPPCAPDNAQCGKSPSDGGMRTFFWSATDFIPSGNAPVEFGALPLRSLADPIKHPMHGLVGALVIGPAGSEVCAANRFARRRTDGSPLQVPGGVSAEMCRADGTRYVDHVLVVQDAVNATRGGMPMPNLSGAEEPDDYGVKAFNYRTEPLWARSANDPGVPFETRNEADYAAILSSRRDGLAGPCASGAPPAEGIAGSAGCDPETPILHARPGEEVRLHFVHPGGHTRQQGFALSGHGFSAFPWMPNPADPEGPPVFSRDAGSFRVGVTNGFGPMMGVTYGFLAGGCDRVAMDYLLRSQASFLFDGGLWGLLRVEGPPVDPAPAAGGIVPYR
ncbi:hypothetical protein RQ831_20995 [Roseomonas gilardii]|uniref:Multicopper oxidase n=1 Tax=Roseomonas gilardii TaxID=257708 RepID=A0ABU3MKK9_9PROT|nr:hypothetical protein [Roseomonas gilardii]MDT8333534.1 hypothetical protein [Roseomonas gilardii]